MHLPTPRAGPPRCCFVFSTLALALIVTASDVSAQIQPITELTLEQLMSVVVSTPSRMSEAWTDAPSRIEVVTADQIKRRGYRSLTDVLRHLPDFKVDVNTDQDLPTDVSVQGLRGTLRIVVMLDGIRISSPTGEPLPIVANYPVHTAKQVEIVYGPGSALYGADAFSAVINIVTQDGAHAPGVKGSVSYGQFGLINTTGSYGTTFGGRGSLVIAGQVLRDEQPNLPRYYPEFGDLSGQRSGTFQTIFGPMTPTLPFSAEYDIPIAAHSLQASAKLGPFSLMLFQSDAKVPNAPAYTPDNVIYSDEAAQRNTLLVTAATYLRTVKAVTSTSTVTYSRHELDPQSGYRNVFSEMEKGYKYAFGTMVKGEQQFQIKWQRHRIATGVTFERTFSIPQTADLNAPIVSRDTPGTIRGTDIVDDFVKIRETNVGVYGQLQSDVHPRLTVTLGGRVDRQSRYGATTNPRLGLVWKSPVHGTVRLLYGTAFLAPSPYQAYSHYGSFYSEDGGATYRSSFWHLPNPDLKPQYKKTFEASLRQPIGNQFTVSGAGFYSRLTNLVREGQAPDDHYSGTFHGWPVDFIEVSGNQGRATIYGASVSADVLQAFGADRHVLARVSTGITSGSVQDVVDGARLPLGGFSPTYLKASADIDWGWWQIAPSLTVFGQQRTMAIALVNDRPVRRTIDGYTTLDLSIRRDHVFKNIDLFLTLENVADARYRHLNLRAYNNVEEFVGAPQNPRRLSVGLAFQLP